MVSLVLYSIWGARRPAWGARAWRGARWRLRLSLPAMAKYDEKLYTPALVKEVQMLIDQGMRTGQVSGSWHKIKSEFTAAKVGWYGRVSPLKAAISRRNRYGLGVTGSDAQAHGEQMISVGFHNVEDACAFEADPGDKEQQVFEDALCKRSGGTIPPWRTPLWWWGGGAMQQFSCTRSSLKRRS